MKKYLLTLLCSAASILALAQGDGWQRKSDIGWYAPNGPTIRVHATGFSIGNKAFLGTGSDGTDRNDFWEYDPSTDSWAQKANLGGVPRIGATGFSIGSKGYIGLGLDSASNELGDFWEYDTTANAWTRKADFGGTARSFAAGFSIGNYGYIGTGLYGTFPNDFWKYDPVADNWIRKADFAGSARFRATGFSIGGKGYIGTGRDGNRLNLSYKTDFWAYDTATDTWTQKADFGGHTRDRACGFSIGNKGYIGLGLNFQDGPENDFWEYDTAADSWTQKANFGGPGRFGAVGFSAGNSAYIATGFDVNNNFDNDLWKYDPVSDSWTQKANFGAMIGSGSIGFSIGSKGFLETAAGNFWQYDTATDSWSQRAAFAGGARGDAIAFSIGAKGYIGLGDSTNATYLKDFWEYDTAANSWTRKADYAGAGSSSSTGFSIGSKGYAGMGYGASVAFSDFWEYDPIADNWTRRADFAGGASAGSAGFGIGNRGYVNMNFIPSGMTTNFLTYDPVADSWIPKATFASGARSGATGFSMGAKGYIGLGFGAGVTYKDFWEYDTAMDNWTQKPDFGGGARDFAVGFSIGNRGYIGSGNAGTGYNPYFDGQGNQVGILLTDFWQYSTAESIRTAVGDFSVSSACPAVSGATFNWESDSSTSLVYGVNPGSNDLGATCWGIRTVAAGDYRDTTGWFGGSQTQAGAYLPRNYVVIPATEPGTAVALRLYCTAGELTNFINYFNSKYGTTLTQNDIRIIQYDGVNQDLDLGNNSNLPADYTSITPSAIGVYGTSDEFRYLDFPVTGFSEFAISLSVPSTPLPLNILDFSAVYQNGTSLLQWQTAEEQHTGSFDILRSTDGRQFTTIGSLRAAGNSQSPLNYYFTDSSAANAGANVLYYQLLEKDLDGRPTYSSIASVNIDAANKGITITPNPAASNVTIRINTTTVANNASLIITDAEGRKLVTRSISLHAGDNEFPVSLAQFSSGVYFIRVQSKETNWQTKFLVK